MTGGGAAEVYRLGSDLSRVGARAIGPLRSVLLLQSQRAVLAWQANARATSGTHGKLYPKSISAELAFGISTVSVDVGPDASMPQGGMGPGFEYGSSNQPPHLDGQKAMDATAPAIEAAIDSAVQGLFP